MTGAADRNRARTLVNAPIREALIDLRCELPEGQDAEALAEFEAAHASIAAEFPAMENSFATNVSAEFRGGADAAVAASTVLRGYHFKNAQGDRIVQFRLDGFTYNKLRPYATWAELRTEAEVLWAKYCALLPGVQVTRLGVRYINEIRVPPGVGFETVFVDPLRRPLGFREGQVQESLERLQVSSRSGLERAIVTRLAREESGGLAVILDIDAFALAPEGSFEVGEVWGRIARLRDRKNEIFFSSLAARGIEMYE